MPNATIGKAPSAAGVNVETIRFYVRKGLIEQPPKESSYRTYSPATIARVRLSGKHNRSASRAAR